MQTVISTEVRTVSQKTRSPLRVGILFDGLDLLEDAWKTEHLLFQCTTKPSLHTSSTIHQLPLFGKVASKHTKSFRRLEVLVMQLPSRKRHSKQFPIIDT